MTTLRRPRCRSSGAYWRGGGEPQRLLGEELGEEEEEDEERVAAMSL